MSEYGSINPSQGSFITIGSTYTAPNDNFNTTSNQRPLNQNYQPTEINSDRPIDPKIFQPSYQPNANATNVQYQQYHPTNMNSTYYHPFYAMNGNGQPNYSFYQPPQILYNCVPINHPGPQPAHYDSAPEPKYAMPPKPQSDNVQHQQYEYHQNIDEHCNRHRRQDPGNRFNTNNCSLAPRDVSDILLEFNPGNRDCMSIRSWVGYCERMRSVYGFNDIVLLYAAIKKLRGNALLWYESMAHVIESWDHFQYEIILEFDKSRDVADVHYQLANRKKKNSESLVEYVYVMRKIASEIELDDKTLIKYILSNLNDFDEKLKYALAVQKLTNINELLDRIKQFENITDYDNKSKSRFENRSYNSNYKNSNNYESKPKSENRSSRFNCLKCDSPHHSTKFCPKGSICSYCKEPGHFETECPKKKSKSSEVRRVVDIECEYVKNVFVNDVPLKAFIDLGSDCVTITKSAVRDLKLKCNSFSQILKGFGNNLVKCTGLVNINMNIDNICFNVDAYVVEDSCQNEPIMIGRSALDKSGLLILKSFNNLQIFNVPTDDYIVKYISDKNTFEILSNKDKNNENLFNKNIASNNLTFETENLPNRKNVIINFEDPALCGVDNSSNVIDEHVDNVNSSFNKSNIVLNSLMQHEDDDDCFDLSLLYESEVDCNNLSLLNDSKQVLLLENVNNSYEPIDDEILNKCINQDIDEYHVNEIKTLLNDYRNCIALNIKEIGLTNKAQIKIKLNNEHPFSYRPYRLSSAQQVKVNEQISDLLNEGIISPSNSEYSSPIIIVKKKTGEDRICIDYRKLNSNTIKDRFPIPNIEDCLQKLGNMEYFTVLDLASGYYQIPVSDCSKKYTSFVTPNGQFEFNRMPFGLANAPAEFQRMINRLCQELGGRIIGYLDDIIIPSKTVAEGISLFREVLDKLLEYGLTLKITKCKIMASTVNYLGHEISKFGIRPGNDKISCVKNFPTPSSVHEVRQFIGLASYFRKFISNFSIIAAPLTNLTRKDFKFCWNDEQENAFQILKQKLCQRDVLVLFDNSKDHEVHTDASSKGIAGVLMQKEDTGVHPVCYFSRKTSDSESKFHSYELEALAVVESLQKFKTYIIGKPIIVVTDCSALRYAATQRDIIPRIARWWLKLLEFDYTVQHRHGRNMQHIDALSRNPTDPPVEIETVSLDIFRIDSNIDEDWIAFLQDNDPDIIQIKSNLNDQRNSEFVVEHGRLYRKSKNDKLLFVVPKGIRGRIIHNFHDELGHMGFERTLTKIRELYWWPRMRQFIKKYIASCMECLYHRENKDANKIALHFIEKVPIPCHTWHLDHLGPFIETKRKNKHILTIVDAFSKFVVLKPVRDTSSRFVVKSLLNLSEYYGMPKRIITDRGSCFTSKCFASFCKENNIQHILNATATPRANGQAERYNRTVLHCMRTMCDSDPAKWDEVLAKIQWSLNSTPHSITKVSPHELLYGFQLRPSADNKLTIKLFDEKTDMKQFSPIDRDNLREEASKKIKTNQKQQKKYFDAKFKSPEKYSLGDLVVVFREPPSTGESRKLNRKFRGPYTVTRILYGDRYQVEEFTNPDGRRRFKGIVPADHMRLVVLPPDEEIDDNYSSSEGDD